MPIYELATLDIGIGANTQAAPAITAWCGESGAKGKLLGLWATDVGALNKVVVLRGFDSAEDVKAERRRTQLSASPFGGGTWLKALTQDSYVPVEGIAPVPAGALGPVYELRSYVVKPGRLPPLVQAWQTQLPDRVPLSPLVVVMHTIDGPTRLTHIWPYKTTNDRAAIRAEAIKRGIWPPKGGADNLTGDMQSWMCLPLPGSPLT